MLINSVPCQISFNMDSVLLSLSPPLSPFSSLLARYAGILAEFFAVLFPVYSRCRFRVYVLSVRSCNPPDIRGRTAHSVRFFHGIVFCELDHIEDTAVKGFADFDKRPHADMLTFSHVGNHIRCQTCL